MLLIGGLLATAAITLPMYAARVAGISRIDLPLLLGTFVRPASMRARLIGLVPHALMSALLIPRLYRAGFRTLGLPSSARSGMLLAGPHLAGSIAGMWFIGVAHPRVGHRGDPGELERHGHVRAPGAFGQHYGVLTPPGLAVGHLVYGGLIGWWLGRQSRAGRGPQQWIH